MSGIHTQVLAWQCEQQDLHNIQVIVCVQCTANTFQPPWSKAAVRLSLMLQVLAMPSS
jgi:hypothetical protein